MKAFRNENSQAARGGEPRLTSSQKKLIVGGKAADLAEIAWEVTFNLSMGSDYLGGTDKEADEKCEAAIKALDDLRDYLRLTV